MKAQKSTLARVSLAALAICSFLALRDLCAVQIGSSDSNSVKLDEYGDLSTDDAAAHLDLLAEKLFKQSKLRGYIVGYSDPRMQRGSYLRRIYGISRYLTESRGIEPERVVIVDGGYKDKFATELWLVPEGATPPPMAPTVARPQVSSSVAYKFDDECLECEPAVDLYLYGLGEGIRFYAEALRENPDAKALIIVRPGTHVGKQRALNEARKGKELLVRKYKIKANRIIVRAGRRRTDNLAVAEMWIVPRGAKSPTVTSNNSFNPAAR